MRWVPRIFSVKINVKEWYFEFIYKINKISSLSIRHHQCPKDMRGSFSQNGYGLNCRGTGKVLFIDYFLKDHKIDLGYCGHQLANLREK